MVKNPSANAGDTREPGLIPRSGRSHGVGKNGNLLQSSYLGNPMDRGAWQATVYGVTKRRTPLRDSTTRTSNRGLRLDSRFSLSLRALICKTQTVKGGVQGAQVRIPHAQRPEQGCSQEALRRALASADTLTGYREEFCPLCYEPTVTNSLLRARRLASSKRCILLVRTSSTWRTFF